MLRDLVMVLELILFYRNAQGTNALAIGELQLLLMLNMVLIFPPSLPS